MTKEEQERIAGRITDDAVETITGIPVPDGKTILWIAAEDMLTMALNGLSREGHQKALGLTAKNIMSRFDRLRNTKWKEA